MGDSRELDRIVCTANDTGFHLGLTSLACFPGRLLNWRTDPSPATAGFKTTAAWLAWLAVLRVDLTGGNLQTYSRLQLRFGQYKNTHSDSKECYSMSIKKTKWPLQLHYQQWFTRDQMINCICFVTFLGVEHFNTHHDSLILTLSQVVYAEQPFFKKAFPNKSTN